MANPTTVQTLPLADLHLPNAPSFWPLSWGWWLCLLFAIALLVVAMHWIQRKKLHNQARREAIKLLKGLNSPAQFDKLNLLLRQMALTYQPRQHVAGLTGEQWLCYLDQQLPVKHRGFMALSAEWQQGLFSAAPLTPDQFNACYQQAKIWIARANFVQSSTKRQEGQHV
ncbi:DUF4381 domain-containing protein [Photobacterium nomapromontoriensis]|uniref:DUF4381 domain-containing protein n=1 Tax=Photobacterium nomapromontoriensis TaxID=2910237 RepID=UPI003D0FDD2A